MNSDRTAVVAIEARLEEKAWNTKRDTCESGGGVAFSSKACG